MEGGIVLSSRRYAEVQREGQRLFIADLSFSAKSCRKTFSLTDQMVWSFFVETICIKYISAWKGF